MGVVERSDGVGRRTTAGDEQRPRRFNLRQPIVEADGEVGQVVETAADFRDEKRGFHGIGLRRCSAASVATA